MPFHSSTPCTGRRRTLFFLLWFGLIGILLTAIILLLVFLPPDEHAESIRTIMKDSVLHEQNKVRFWGLTVNPAVISAYLVTAVLLGAALLLRLLVIPRFSYVPGRWQSVLELTVEFITDQTKPLLGRSPYVVRPYLFGAGIYICFSTLFELLGVQVTAMNGHILALPAPISDINAALAMGFLSFAVIIGTGILCGGRCGVLRMLKDISLPLSVSFRLFGSLLSGLLVTELVYYYLPLSFVLPVLVGLLFTIPHALIQSYVLITLVSELCNECAIRHPPKGLRSQRKKEQLS